MASVDGDDVSDLWGETTGTYTFRGIEYVSDVTNPQSVTMCILLPTGGFRHTGRDTVWRICAIPTGGSVAHTPM